MNPAPLSDSDLDHLEQLLEADVFQGDAMRLDEIQAGAGRPGDLAAGSAG
jgi:uncharacterized protein